MLWLILFAASLPLTLIFGRFYCGYICPMNTAMEIVEGVKGKLKLKRLDKPQWLKSTFAWVALAISVAAMLLLKKFAHISLPIMLIWVGISIILTLFFKAEVFHDYICPFGALQRLFGKFSLLGRKVNNDKCVGCNICVKSCPTNAITIVEVKTAINTNLDIESDNSQEDSALEVVDKIEKKAATNTSDCIENDNCQEGHSAETTTKIEKKALINTTNCIQCNNCQEICPKEAINYTKNKK